MGELFFILLRELPTRDDLAQDQPFNCLGNSIVTISCLELVYELRDLSYLSHALQHTDLLLELFDLRLMSVLRYLL